MICSFTVLEKFQRFWLDLDQDVLFSNGLCQSLREISLRWSATVEGSVGLRTINERINETRAVTAGAGAAGADHGCAERGATGWHLAHYPEPERKGEARSPQASTQSAQRQARSGVGRPGVLE